jgi:Flp pilus assembly protein TadD
MKRFFGTARRICLAILLVFVPASIQAQSNNYIDGLVFNQSGVPLSDMDVELLNELSITLKRVRTNGSGRFTFDRLSSGNFKVRVLTYNTNYAEQVQDVNIVTIPRGGSGGFSSDRVYLEFYLRLDKRKAKTGSPGAASAVFVQADIPAEAQRLYEKGINELEEKKESGLVNLKKAVETFPTYYDALDRLGSEMVQKKQYRDAVPYLIKAIEVNQRSFSSFYSLGIASYNLKQLKEAGEAFRAATIINPQSFNANLWYGIVLRADGSYEKAEKALVQAKSLTKKPVAEVHYQLALLYNRIGRNADAAKELEEFLRIEPNSNKAQEIRNLIGQLRGKGN